MSQGSVLVTGASGFAGSHLCRAFLEAGWSVRGLDINPPDATLSREVEFVCADVRDRHAVSRAVSGCAVVIDNAALVPVARVSAQGYHSVNVTGCDRTLAAAHAEGAYLVHISSSAIYGVPARLPVDRSTPFAPFEPYGESKAVAESRLVRWRAKGLRAASIRPRTLLGEGRLGLFDLIFGRIRSGRLIPLLGGGSNHVQMCDVRDFCSAVLSAVERRAAGDYNIGSASFGTVREDMQALIDYAGSGSRLVSVPAVALAAVLAPLDRVGRSPINVWHWRSAPKSFYFDLSDTVDELGWQPRYSNLEAMTDAYRHYLESHTETGHSAHRQPLVGTVARLLKGGR